MQQQQRQPFKKYKARKCNPFLLGLLPLEILQLIYYYLNTLDVCRYLFHFFVMNKRFSLVSLQFFEYAFSWMKSIRIEKNIDAHKMVTFLYAKLSVTNSIKNIKSIHICGQGLDKNSISTVLKFSKLESLVIKSCFDCLFKVEDYTEIILSLKNLKDFQINNPRDFRGHNITTDSIIRSKEFSSIRLNLLNPGQNVLLPLLNPAKIEYLNIECPDPLLLNTLSKFTSLKILKLYASSESTNLSEIIKILPLEEFHLKWFSIDLKTIKKFVFDIDQSNIRSIITGGCVNLLENDSFDFLKSLTKLNKFGLIHQNFVDTDLFLPISTINNITVLKLERVYCGISGPKWFEPILKMNLIKLKLDNLNIDNSVLVKIGNIKTLKVLKISSLDKITNNGVKQLLHISNILYLSISYCYYIEKSIEKLKSKSINVLYKPYSNSRSCDSLNSILDRIEEIECFIKNPEESLDIEFKISLARIKADQLGPTVVPTGIKDDLYPYYKSFHERLDICKQFLEKSKRDLRIN